MQHADAVIGARQSGTTSFWFERSGLECFATLHSPDGQPRGGIVLCNAVGFEGQTAYRTLWLLAEELVRRGFAVLRFDYYGTGDSGGDPVDVDLVSLWRESLHGAIDTLRTATGFESVTLVGMRFGAALTQLVARERDDIGALVMWWPVLSGSLFARELRAASMFEASTRPEPDVSSDSKPRGLEVVGYEFWKPTLDAMKSINLEKSDDPAGAPSVLLLERDGEQRCKALAETWSALGADVDRAEAPGFGDFMIDNETKSVTPVDAVQQVVSWIDQHADGRTTAIDQLPSPPAVRPTIEVSGGSQEASVTLEGLLRGVITRPAQTARGRTGVVLATLGATARSGPGRLHTRLARHWAALGFPVLRIDLMGAGESLSGVDPLAWDQPYDRSRISEVASAASWLVETQGVDRVVLFGLCSGAYNAFHAALEGAPAAAVVLVNPYILYLKPGENVQGSLNAAIGAGYELQRSLGSGEKWLNLIRSPKALVAAYARLLELLRKGALRGVLRAVRAKVRDLLERLRLVTPKPPQLLEDLDRLTSEGTSVTMIFAPGEPGEHYVRTVGGTGLERLLARPNLNIVQVPGGDHIFNPPGSRDRFVEVATGLLHDTEAANFEQRRAP
jgi:pimeloyl-ACP methyl ester carboxylesterase